MSPIHNKLLLTCALIAGLLYLYGVAVYWDQTHQKALMLNPKTLKTKQQALAAPDQWRAEEGLSNYGLSNFSIAGMNHAQIKDISSLQGKRVDHRELYIQQLVNDRVHRLSRQHYESQLQQGAIQWLPHYSRYWRVSLNLVHLRARQFAFVGEWRADFSPADLQPATIVVQYRPDFETLSNKAVLITSLIKRGGTRWITSSQSINPSKFKQTGITQELFTDDSRDITYRVHWPRAGLFADTVGSSFVIVDTFAIPKAENHVDVFLQQPQLSLSQQLSYDGGKDQ